MADRVFNTGPSLRCIVRCHYLLRPPPPPPAAHGRDPLSPAGCSQRCIFSRDGCIFCQEAFFYIYATFINGSGFHRAFIECVLGCTFVRHYYFLRSPRGQVDPTIIYRRMLPAVHIFTGRVFFFCHEIFFYTYAPFINGDFKEVL